MSVPALSWIDGREGDAIAVTDRGLQYADGLFETLRVHNGRIRFIDLHLDRLQNGATRLGLIAPARAALRDEWQAAAVSLGEGMLKMLLTRGDALRRGYGSSGHGQARRILLGYRAEGARPPPSLILWHCQLRLGENPALAGLKTLSRLEQVLATDEWQAAASHHQIDLHEGLVGSSSGHLVSGSCSNLFWRTGNILNTPSLDGCGVAGIMRRVVLREASALGLPVCETSANLEVLLQADEVFMTNIRWQLLPVATLWFDQGRAQRQWATPGDYASRLSAHIDRLDS